jgi:hypothetical protein
LAGQSFANESLSDLDLRNAVAPGATFRSCTFERCTLALANLGGATFVDCVFTDCDLRQAILVARFYGCTFARCDLDQANLQGADISETQLLACRAQYSNWSQATLVNTRIDCDLHGAVLNLAVTENVDWGGSMLWSAVVPLNCAFVTGNAFDTRQIEMFVALMALAKIPAQLREQLEAIVPRRRLNAVARLVGSGPVPEPSSSSSRGTWPAAVESSESD